MKCVVNDPFGALRSTGSWGRIEWGLNIIVGVGAGGLEGGASCSRFLREAMRSSRALRSVAAGAGGVCWWRS